MSRLLVTNKNGLQRLMEIGDHPWIHPDITVDWDERSDGVLPDPMPELGGLYNDGGFLAVDPARKSAHDVAYAAKLAQEQSEEAVKTDTANRRAQIIALLSDWDNATAAQVKQAVRYLLMRDLRQ